MTPEDIRAIVREAVEETLTSLGMDASSSAAKGELQKDHAWVRNRRRLEEKVSWQVIVVIVTAVVGAVLSTAAMAFKVIFGNN